MWTPLIGSRLIEEGEQHRVLTVGERAQFAAGGPLAITVVFVEGAGYRALVD